MTGSRSAGDEHGAGAVLALTIAAAAVVAASATLVACALVVASTRLDGAADAAALAAADAAAGWVADDPCARAAMLAEANGARVVACTIDGIEATVVVADVSGAPVRATAIAGPAPDAEGAR